MLKWYIFNDIRRNSLLGIHSFKAEGEDDKDKI